jgi:hypothetical protein
VPAYGWLTEFVPAYGWLTEFVPAYGWLTEFAANLRFACRKLQAAHTLIPKLQLFKAKRNFTPIY